MERRYAKILNDDAFKVVILAPGNERLLTKIIQLLLPDIRIAGLRFDDKEQHGLVVSDKNATFDLLCTTEDDLLRMLYNASELANMPIKKRKDYDDIIMNELDQLIRMNMARDEGLAEGRAEGRDEEKLGIAKKLLAMGLPLDQVAEATGLPKNEIEALR